MKLEVGMYIRYIPTQGEYTQKISKITKMENRILDMGYQLDNEKDLVFSCHFDQIINASHNIIDLIGVGDVIIDKEGHKYPINYEFETDYNNEYKSYEITIDDYITLFFKDGLSIVTKEQFEAMQYKVV